MSRTRPNIPQMVRKCKRCGTQNITSETAARGKTKPEIGFLMICENGHKAAWCRTVESAIKTWNRENE